MSSSKASNMIAVIAQVGKVANDPDVIAAKEYYDCMVRMRALNVVDDSDVESAALVLSILRSIAAQS